MIKNISFAVKEHLIITGNLQSFDLLLQITVALIYSWSRNIGIKTTLCVTTRHSARWDKISLIRIRSLIMQLSLGLSRQSINENILELMNTFDIYSLDFQLMGYKSYQLTKFIRNFIHRVVQTAIIF